jgi:DNA polymerase-1
MTKRLLIIDSNLYASRLYHDLIRTDNIADIDTLTKVIKDRLSWMLSRHHPTHVVSVYDVGKSAYRTTIYPNYKKNRKHNQERELFIRYFRAIMESSGVCCISAEGVEADDIVATIVNRRMDIFGENIATVIDIIYVRV